MAIVLVFTFVVGMLSHSPAPTLAASCTSEIMAANESIPGFVQFEGCVE